MVVLINQYLDNLDMQINKKMEIDEASMLEEIRFLLKLTIEDFVYQMNWPNTKYYDYIKNGRRRTGKEARQKTHPTIFKIFTGINSAIKEYDHWQEKASQITSIVIKYLLPVVEYPNMNDKNKNI